MNATFTVNGKTYEILRTNHLILQFENIKQQNQGLTAEEEQGIAILQDKYLRMERLAERVLEVEKRFYETFSQSDEEIYNRAKAHYEKEYAEVVKFEAEQNGVFAKAQKNGRDNARRVVIKALQIDNKGNAIRTEEEATEIWNAFVEEYGIEGEAEWLTWFINFLTGRDKVEDDPFVAQAKAKAEQKANMRKGILKAK